MEEDNPTQFDRVLTWVGWFLAFLGIAFGIVVLAYLVFG